MQLAQLVKLHFTDIVTRGVLLWFLSFLTTALEQGDQRSIPRDLWSPIMESNVLDHFVTLAHHFTYPYLVRS